MQNSVMMLCHNTNGVRAVICGARGKVRYSIVSSESGYTLQDHNVAVSRFQQKPVERNPESFACQPPFSVRNFSIVFCPVVREGIAARKRMLLTGVAPYGEPIQS